MALTRADMRGLVKNNIGNRTDLDSNINTWLDWALRDIQRRNDWRDLEQEFTLDLQTDVKTYTLDSTIQSIQTLRLSDYSSSTYSGSRELPLLSQYEMDKLVPRAEQDSTGGKPRFATFYNSQLALWPIPDATTYRVTYRAKIKITVFAGDSSVSVITQIDDLLVARATFYAQLMLEEANLAAIFNSIYEDGLAAAIKEDRKQSAMRLVAQQFGRMEVALPSTADPFYRNPRSNSWR